MKNNHFIDVGGNTGQTFDEFLSKSQAFDGWSVWTLEPSPRHVPALMDTVRRHSGRYSIVVCPFGLRGISGALSFFEKDDARGDSFEALLASDHPVNNLANGFEICAFAIGVDDFLAGITDANKIVLKLDCEGSEYDILAALLKSPHLKRISAIFVEWHSVGSKPAMDPQEMVAEYERRGIPLQRWTL